MFSISDGIVSEVGNKIQAGNYIKVMHSNGYESSYSHTFSSLTVDAKVNAGATIGYTDLSGASTGAHLHFVS